MKGLYAILDENNFNFKLLDKYVSLMIKNHIRIFQIRIKSSITNKKLDLINKINKLCSINNSLLILNDFIDISKELNLDGVHIGCNDKSLLYAKKILGEKKIIGISCYSDLNLALIAQQNGASYVSFGSLYKTETKDNPVNLNINIINQARKSIKIPICLIGGINSSNINSAIKLNCNLIAISKGLSSNNDIIKVSKIYYDQKK